METKLKPEPKFRYSQLNEMVKQVEEEATLLEGEVIFAKPNRRVAIMSNPKFYQILIVLRDRIRTIREMIKGEK